MSKNNKMTLILRLILGTIAFGLFGCIYYMGIVCPSFKPPFDVIYRGIGCGMVFPVYFLLVPGYIKKLFPESRYLGAIVSAASFIIAVVLVFIIFPMQST